MLLKYYQVLLLLLLPAIINAQERYANRWKEIKRTDRKGNTVAYTDTMRINSVTEESLKMRRGSFEYEGTISNDLLEIGEEQYQIVRSGDTSLTIGDDDYIHIMTRELKDLSAADAATFMAEHTLPQKPVASITRELLQGQWQTYKRQTKRDRKEQIRYGTMIKMISFRMPESQPDPNYVLTDNGSRYAIKAFKDADMIVTDTDRKAHRITVWRLTKEELILEDEASILYYLKQF